MNGFPMWMFHEKRGAKILKSEDELKELGPGWFDSPAKFPKEVEKEVKDAELSKEILEYQKKFEKAESAKAPIKPIRRGSAKA